MLVTGRGVSNFEPQKRLETTGKINTSQGVTTPQNEFKKQVQGRGCYDCTHFTKHKEIGFTVCYCDVLRSDLQDPTIMNIIKQGCDDFELDTKKLSGKA